MLTFKTTPDSEQQNRGWVVDLIEAYHGEDYVGYLKAGYIPTENFEEFYPTVFNYMSQIGGNCGIFDYYEKHFHWKSLDESGKRCLIRNCRNTRGIAKDLDDISKTISEESLDNFISDLEKKILKSDVGKKFKSFKEFHFNKPLVDFISVSDRFRRKGFGIQIYLEGARHFKNKGLFLHASDCQSESAEKAWEKLTRLGYVRSYTQKDGRERRVIDLSQKKT